MEGAAGRPSAASGDMYSGVPAPPPVERVEIAESQIRATPKSATRGAEESSMRILADFGAAHVVHDQAEGLALGDHIPHPHDVGAVHPLEGVALLEEGVNDIALPREFGTQFLEGEGLLRSLLVPLPHIALRTRSNAFLKNVNRA